MGRSSPAVPASPAPSPPSAVRPMNGEETPPHKWGGAAPKQNLLDRAREVDVRVETVGEVVASHEVDASGVDDVEAAKWIEAHLEEVAKCEVTGRRDFDWVDQAVVHRAAKARRRARVHMPVS